MYLLVVCNLAYIACVFTLLAVDDDSYFALRKTEAQAFELFCLVEQYFSISISYHSRSSWRSAEGGRRPAKGIAGGGGPQATGSAGGGGPPATGGRAAGGRPPATGASAGGGGGGGGPSATGGGGRPPRGGGEALHLQLLVMAEENTIMPSYSINYQQIRK
uniref:Uncharacterized protein n=1 Tax=Amphimedon queenslandica TaxID=400682 RepID=A0A1X7UXC0_AMPQE